ncbi:MAG: hypothetical protein SCALA702_34960 [Melioribacteraceae bacterium]|nr:MAG: hypothetical protein SCALA702_34960 [Melioribacteraceae bacterium]
MYSSNKIINVVSITVVGLIGFLFILKYSVIYNFFPAIITSTYAALFYIFFLYLGKHDLSRYKFLNLKFFKYLFIISFILSILYVLVVPRIGEIGRVPAIIDWLDLYFAGEFPYNSGYTPSSFPALFFMAMPFYFINFLGIFEIAGFGLFLFLLYKGSTNTTELSHRFLLLLATPVIYYEFVVRCELFFNVTFILYLIYLAEKYLDTQKLSSRFVLIAVAFGIGLSTRSVVAVIYAIYLLYRFRYDLKNMIFFSIVIAAVFIGMLVPFIMWDVDAFLNNGPFAIQSHLSNLPFFVSLLFILSALLAGWMVSTLQEVFFTSGLIIFLMVMLSFILKIYQFGFDTAFFHDKIDLSYLAFVIPLMVLSVSDYGVNKYRGRYF